jgi:hypothetical protein
MLRAYVCVACEKVISDKSEVPSLISLFSKLTVNVPEGIEIPRDAATPKEWAVFTIWETEPGDEQQEYFQCTQLLYPDQSQFGDTSRTKIPVELNKRGQVTIQIIGFPIGQAGEYTVRTWVERNGERVISPIEFGIGLTVVRGAGLKPSIPAPAPVS